MAVAALWGLAAGGAAVALGATTTTALAIGAGAAVLSSGNTQRKDIKKASQQAAASQSEIGIQNEKNILAQGAESHRRSSRDFDSILGKTSAVIQGTGVKGLSRRRYMEGLQIEKQKQLDWINTSSISRGEAARKGAFASASNTLASGNISANSALSNSLISAFNIVSPTFT